MFLAACSSAVLFANGTSSCEASVAVFYGSRQVERGTFSRLCCVMFVSPREWKDSIQGPKNRMILMVLQLNCEQFLERSSYLTCDLPHTIMLHQERS
ncbi:hypothetical protein RRG08_030228 [Elysia crispata]|uniref:Secreted protein n=1 Tax=Elysia crispata TaxID=231223 RepID=A0AAE1AIX4_9GAST|nr:hypothetical protein RRG08_030228 [Elysia crispata]